MKFREFIKIDEVGTSTSCIAGFKRISIPLTRRIFPPELNWTDPEEKTGKKNPYRVPQLDEMNLADPTNDAQQQGDDKVPLMQQSSYDAKNAAQNALQMAAEYDAHPEGKQLATVLKTISSSYNRIEGQWKQAANMAGTYEQQAKQNALNNQRQAAQNGTNPAQSAANAISSVGNKVAGIISQGGALSASASSATR